MKITIIRDNAPHQGQLASWNALNRGTVHVRIADIPNDILREMLEGDCRMRQHVLHVDGYLYTVAEGCERVSAFAHSPTGKLRMINYRISQVVMDGDYAMLYVYLDSSHSYVILAREFNDYYLGKCGRVIPHPSPVITIFPGNYEDVPPAIVQLSEFVECCSARFDTASDDASNDSQNYHVRLNAHLTAEEMDRIEKVITTRDLAVKLTPGFLVACGELGITIDDKIHHF